MKHGKRPTVKQKKILKTKGLNSENWLIVSDTHERMIAIHRNTGTTKTIQKGGE